ncbi:MAG: aminoglycoside phosphotransferase family protein [Saprospiraceae bacterium]|nr:aminoglycoside phosphotransferase family protein [Saprospiraceae bacterium]
MKIELPKSFRKTIISRYGEYGREWLEALPDIVQSCLDLWALRPISSPFSLSYNYLCVVERAGGSQAVLKIGHPHEPELLREMEALGHFGHVNMVRLLERDSWLGAMLLERLQPGTTLRHVRAKDDERATRLAAGLIGDMTAPIPENSSFPDIAEWGAILSEPGELSAAPFPYADTIGRAKNLLSELQLPSGKRKLLHGDLHHANILLDQDRGWVAIDPKGVVGDPAFNFARFIHNFWEETPDRDLVERRLVILSEYSAYPVDRLAAWAYVDFVIGRCWIWEERPGKARDWESGRLLEAFF